MFEIKYKIIEYEETILEKHEIYGEYGQFQLCINDKTYGMFLENNTDVFNVQIYWWLYYLLEALIILKENEYVLISDYETTDTWIEIQKKGDFVYFSIVEIEAFYNTNFVEKGKPSGLVYTNLKDEKVELKCFVKEIINKAEKYLNEIKESNNSEHNMILNFENKLLEAKKIVDAKVK